MTNKLTENKGNKESIIVMYQRLLPLHTPCHKKLKSCDKQRNVQKNIVLDVTSLTAMFERSLHYLILKMPIQIKLLSAKET